MLSRWLGFPSFQRVLSAHFWDGWPIEMQQIELNNHKAVAMKEGAHNDNVNR
jgi:hypothetical protein